VYTAYLATLTAIYCLRMVY